MVYSPEIKNYCLSVYNIFFNELHLKSIETTDKIKKIFGVSRASVFKWIKESKNNTIKEKRKIRKGIITD